MKNKLFIISRRGFQIHSDPYKKSKATYVRMLLYLYLMCMCRSRKAAVCSSPLITSSCQTMTRPGRTCWFGSSALQSMVSSKTPKEVRLSVLCHIFDIQNCKPLECGYHHRQTGQGLGRNQ